MKHDEWQRVKDLFGSVLTCPAAERESFLSIQQDPPEVIDEVRSLLRTYEEQPSFLEDAHPQWPEDLDKATSPEPLAGRRIGAWELVREIGHGGMGVVWEARRADGQYEQRAAIKLLPAGLLDQQSVLRFRDERQILARLDHPSIARLLDGGTLPDGSPYLVMEFVEGPSIDLWCDREKLDVRRRIELFLPVCDAVEYAHRHLVIHRDIKPANILVRPDGAPKLLDFGIAKLVSDGGAVASTRRLLTPEFASPEQLRGDVVTTATDIFSLGILLYFLLTGSRPFSTAEGDTLETLRAVCEEDPKLPSVVAPARQRELRGELDAIVLQALRKNPEERYPSAHAFAADLRAWLEGREVTAVTPSRWQRWGKYVRRHKTQSIAVAAAAVSLVAGTCVSLWQANVAERQRERAERRFRDVRRFGRSVLFELHDAIRNLPGSTPARNLLLARATEFLDDLANDPSSDAGMKLELAQGYERLGNVQGGGFSDNVGRRDDAIASFKKSVRLGEAALAATHGVDASLLLLEAYDDLTRALLNKNDRAQAEQWHMKYTDLANQVEKRYPGDVRAEEAVAQSYSLRAFYETQSSQYARARELYRMSLQRFERLPSDAPGYKEAQSQYAFALKRLGALLIVDRSLDEAEKCYRKALAIEDGELASRPNDITLRVSRTFTLSDLALISRKKGDLRSAGTLYEEVLQARREALARDPANLRNLNLTGNACIYLARLSSDLKEHHKAIQLATQAIALAQRAADIESQRKEIRDLAFARVVLANLILQADANAKFRPGPGETRDDARTALLQARPALLQPNTGEALAPEEAELRSDYEDAWRQIKNF